MQTIEPSTQVWSVAASVLMANVLEAESQALPYIYHCRSGDHHCPTVGDLAYPQLAVVHWYMHKLFEAIGVGRVLTACTEPT